MYKTYNSYIKPTTPISNTQHMHRTYNTCMEYATSV